MQQQHVLPSCRPLLCSFLTKGQSNCTLINTHSNLLVPALHVVLQGCMLSDISPAVHIVFDV
jgi:hypothetical protein